MFVWILAGIALFVLIRKTNTVDEPQYDGLTCDGVWVEIYKSNRCRYCVDAMPEFYKLLKMGIDVRVYDCDQAEHAGKFAQRQVNSYPTILMVRLSAIGEEEITEYRGERTAGAMCGYMMRTFGRKE